MLSFHAPMWISAVWLSLTFAITFSLGATSLQGWMLASVVGLIPVFVLLKLWNNGPPPTIAEVLHSTEDRR